MEMKVEFERRCPECGRELVEAADWPDDWLVCLNCLHSEESEEGKGRESARTDRAGVGASR